MSARSFSLPTKAGMVLLIVLGLFLLGVLLTPPAAPVQAVTVQPAQPVSNATDEVNGTLASFTALIPQPIFIYIPGVAK